MRERFHPNRAALFLVVFAALFGGFLFTASPARAASPELYSSSFFSTSSLVSYYRFENNATDSKGSSNGTTASTTYVAGFEGTAFVSSSVETADLGNLISSWQPR
jgi:hypothetical protein